MTAALFFLALGAAARLTRLITDDRLLGRLRAWALRRWGSEHPITYWLYCPWCVSPYIGGAVFTTAWFYGDTAAFVIVACTLTASWLIGVSSSWLDAPAGEAQ
ncbi:MAG: hypothetical protein QM658_03170 [Gordonia sp. (in: high G+C Gram-positive bacteria)]